MGFEPTSRKGHGLANRLGQPYRTTFQNQWTDRKSNSDLRHARASSSLWTISPYSCSGPPGNRTPIAWVQTKRLPFGPAARIVKRSVPELNRVFLLTTEVCFQNTYRPCRISDPGWNRTSTFLVVTQASLPLDHGIVLLSVTEVGLEPTGTRLSTSPLCQFAYPVISCGFGSCTRLSRLMRPG